MSIYVIQKTAGEYKNQKKIRKRKTAAAAFQVIGIYDRNCIDSDFVRKGNHLRRERRYNRRSSRESDGGGFRGDRCDTGGESHTRSRVAQNQEWNLFLVNPWNPIPDNYEPELTYLKNGQAVDSRCYPELQQMMDDCRAAGLEPLICASYRTMEKQEALFDTRSRVIQEGCPENEVEAEAAKVVAYPETSEHQLGLALDIVDVSYQQLDTEQENTPVQQCAAEEQLEVRICPPLSY